EARTIVRHLRRRRVAADAERRARGVDHALPGAGRDVPEVGGVAAPGARRGATRRDARERRRGHAPAQRRHLRLISASESPLCESPLTRGREITSFGARVVIGCPTRTIFLSFRGKPWHILPAAVGGGDERLSRDFASVC